MVRVGCNAFRNDDFLLFLRPEVNIGAKYRAKVERLTEVPCCLSNFSHHAQMSPRSGLAAIARSNHWRAFSILRSDQNNRATVQRTRGSSDALRKASAERDLRAGRGSAQIAIDHRRPDVGHSCRPIDLSQNHNDSAEWKRLYLWLGRSWLELRFRFFPRRRRPLPKEGHLRDWRVLPCQATLEL